MKKQSSRNLAFPIPAPFALVLIISLLVSCSGKKEQEMNRVSDHQRDMFLANVLEESLFDYILDIWYPLNIDSIHGGYASAFNYDWSLSEGSQEKALVQQARHLWTTSFVLEHYPDRRQFLEYANHGFRFLKSAMWDREFGGFYPYLDQDGNKNPERIKEKRSYGQAFALYGLSRYYRVSHNPEALELARLTFRWMDEHAYDPFYGGYYEFLWRDGTPMTAQDSLNVKLGDTPGIGLKDYNSSIHIMEALTELYLVWPDTLVRTRLEEMFVLIRDTFVHQDGYLQLYFNADWTLVPEKEMQKRSPTNHWYTPHFTYGHDVETAFLLLETAHILELEDEERTRQTARKLVDHSLDSGWDNEYGGFFDAGKVYGEKIEIINRSKSWWGQVEGMNALLLMHRLYPDDRRYGQLFLKAWEHIDTYLIDKEHGGWYNAALDTSPGNKRDLKSHVWKTTYHNTRGMVNCIRMLRDNEQ